ncbi:MAG: hypothetical protein INR65_00405 [Gluconacetobacter diazotrophicus]|nr:hypothetical protein [Gluconacetobacter diazotrophicus]
MTAETGDARSGSCSRKIILIEEGRNLFGHRRLLRHLAAAVAALLPQDWFELRSLEDADLPAGRDHCMLERVGGPPVGSFHLWRDDGSVWVRALPELDEASGEASRCHRHRDVAEAVAAIAAAINRQLRGWSLPPVTVPDRRTGDGSRNEECRRLLDSTRNTIERMKATERAFRVLVTDAWNELHTLQQQLADDHD